MAKSFHELPEKGDSSNIESMAVKGSPIFASPTSPMIPTPGARVFWIGTAASEESPATQIPTPIITI